MVYNLKTFLYKHFLSNWVNNSFNTVTTVSGLTLLEYFVNPAISAYNRVISSNFSVRFMVLEGLDRNLSNKCFGNK